MFSSDDESCDSLDFFDQSRNNISPREDSTSDDGRRDKEDEYDRESDGGRSTTSSSLSRLKKRVTFPTEDNLVFIREIPPRDFYSDSDSPTDSCGSEDSQSDSESDDLGEELSDKLQICSENTPSTTIAKGKYEISTTRKSVNKVAQITGASLNNKSDANKKVSVKKRRIKSAPPSLESKSTQEKPKAKVLKPRAKSATVRSNDKSKVNVKKVKVKSSKESKKCTNTKLKPTGSTTTNEMSDTVNGGCAGIIEVDTRVIKQTNDIHIVKAHRLSNSNDNLWSLIDCDSRDSVSCTGTGNGIYNMNKSFDHISKRSVSNNNERPDVRAMSTTDRRLYSWLMANGNVPNPRYQTPSISPLWDCSQTESQTVKAHI